MRQLLICILASSILLASGPSFAGKANKRIQTLSNEKLQQLAKADGRWVYLAGFELKRKKQHLLCAKKKRQKTPMCVIASTKGKILQRTVGFGLFKRHRALGFRVVSKSSDLWLPMLLQGNNKNNSGTTNNSGFDDYRDAFGHDLSNVNIHTNGGSNLSDTIGAGAFAVGSDIVMGGETSPGPSSTKLAHEAAHIIETSGGGGNPSGNTGEEDSSGSDSSSNDDSSSGSGSGNGSGSNGSNGSGSGGSGSK